jgi:hypothetical protein
MPRIARGPRYYDSKNGWFANFPGERPLRLTTGPKKETEEFAQEKYRAESEARRIEVNGDRGMVWAVLNAYLVDFENRVKNGDSSASTLRMHRLSRSAEVISQH